MKDWQWIKFRYFVEPTEDGWRVCDSEDREIVDVELASELYLSVRRKSFIYLFGSVSQHSALDDALLTAISMNGA